MRLPSLHFDLRAILAGAALLAGAGPLRAQSQEAALRYHWAQEARREGDARRAAAWLGEAVAIDPAAPLPRLEWAAALLAIGDAPAAEAALEPLAAWWETDPRRPGLEARYARLRGALANRRGDLDEAIAWYERAIERSPLDLGLRAQLIGHYRARGDEERALVHLHASAAALPGNAELQAELGRSLLGLGRWSEAEAVFVRATSIEPRLEAGWDGIGVARTRRGDYAGAEEALREGLRVAPASATLYEHLGDALLGAGNVAGALNAYERAAVLAPAETRLADKIDRARAALPR